jgi:hypothetical protein
MTSGFLEGAPNTPRAQKLYTTKIWPRTTTLTPREA